MTNTNTVVCAGCGAFICYGGWAGTVPPRCATCILVSDPVPVQPCPQRAEVVPCAPPCEAAAQALLVYIWETRRNGHQDSGLYLRAKELERCLR